MTPQAEIEVRFVSPLLPLPNVGRKFVNIPSEISNAFLGEETAIGALAINLPAGKVYEITIRIQAIEE